MRKTYVYLFSLYLCGIFSFPVTTLAQEFKVVDSKQTLEVNLPPGVPCLKCDLLSPKMGPKIQTIYQMYTYGMDRTTRDQWIPKGIMRRGDEIRVEIITVSPNSPITGALKRLGMTRMDQFQRIINGWILPSRFVAICEMEEVSELRVVYEPMVHSGSTTSFGDIAQRSSNARAAFSLSGSGVKVGVLSDSYNNLGGEAAGIATGDIPGVGNPSGFTTPVDVVADLASGTGSDEGRAMIEIIHDVAPGAELAFATAFEGIASFANNIQALQAAGCDVIVDDVLSFATPMFQDGVTAQAVDAVTALGATYFSSAGNQAQESYEQINAPVSGVLGNFTIPIGSPTVNVPYFLLDFGPVGGPADFFLGVKIPAGNTATFILQWNESFNSVSGVGASTDLDLFLINAAGTTILEASLFNNVGGDALEVVQFTNLTASDTFSLAIGSPQASFIGFPTLIKTVAFLAEFTEYQTFSSTSYGQNNASSTIGVGASFWGQTPAFGVTPPVLETFSSRGGTPILFDIAGNPVNIQRNKPDITAPDGGNTTFFGQLINFPPFDTDAFLNFFGTSASAPHAAGVAALMYEVDPTITPAAVQTFMEGNTIDIGPAGYDFDSGFGLIDANAIIVDVNASLPVELLSLETEVLDNTVNVTWTASDEVALSGYEVLLSFGGEEAETVGFVPARNISDQVQSYTFAQENLAPGRYTVQLRSIDLDGTSQFSPKVNFEIGDIGLTFDFFSEEGILNVQPEFAVDREFVLSLWDIQGREIWRTDFNAQQVLRIHETELGSSQLLVYKIQAKNGSSSQRGKIAIQ
ncbi:MAG: S8 family serine peptidase [Bacteroidota bacterium]